MNIKKYILIFVYVIGLVITVNMALNKAQEVALASTGTINLIVYCILHIAYYTLIFSFFVSKSRSIYNIIKERSEEGTSMIVFMCICSFISSLLFVGFLGVSNSIDADISWNCDVMFYYITLKVGTMFIVLIIDRICSSLDKKADNIKNNIIPINSNRKEG